MLKQEFKLYIQKYFFVIFFIALIPLLSYGIWLFYPSNSLNILVLDKTVPNDTYPEHQSVFWVLEHNKYLTNTGKFYMMEKDYLGFFPDDSADHGTVRDWSKLTDLEMKKRVSELDVIFWQTPMGCMKIISTTVPEKNSQKKSTVG